MLSVLRIHLVSEIPVVGCEITPYVVLRLPDGSISNEDVLESAPLGGHYMRYKWYRIQTNGKFAVCSIHPTERATLQCVVCLKAKVPSAKSFHCSTRCFSDAWQHHLVMHDPATNSMIANGNEEEQSLGRFSSHISERSPGDTCFEVGCSRTYIPSADDIGHVLKFECVPVDAETRLPVGNVSTITTSCVITAPSPSPRRMIRVSGADFQGNTDTDERTLKFRVLSYNILADHYATTDKYGYCPSWALSWSYRRQNLLKEIVGYNADIICLQEVQSSHFKDFFAPELSKHGYDGLYKKKTTKIDNGNPDRIDGCATFFRKERFSCFKKYEVEFNEAAKLLSNAVIQPDHKELVLNRLIEDNIALLVVLEPKLPNYGVGNCHTRHLLCVANTQVNVHQDCNDVKLWQVHTLLRGLEKISSAGAIPVLICGDFSSVPGSTPHSLLTMGKVDLLHPDMAVDPLGILRLIKKVNHQLPLVSAYSSFSLMAGMSFDLENQRRKMNPRSNEPLFTMWTRDFIGTHDYIFYTADSLTVESLLELLDEDNLRKNSALPSPEWSSDHIALLVEFNCRPRTTC